MLELIQNMKKNSILETIDALANKFPDEVVFSTSFGIEDQVLTDMIAKVGLDIEIFTLDTGRLFQETYSTWNSTLSKYDIKIKSYFPEASAVQKLVSEKGPNSFYDSLENRKECCFIRKVEPLKRAIQGKKIWITGIRSEQSADRHIEDAFEWDEANQILKYHPLLDWTFEQVQQYIKENNVPYNPLHDKGFVSIGCLPCTRAIKPGEDFRSGRWWWEDSTKKECGLHVHEEKYT